MEISLSDLKELIAPNSGPTVALGLKAELDNKVVIRTVTYHYSGIVTEVDDGRVLLRFAAWIADSGRWSKFLETGSAEEVEMYPNGVSIALASIVDWSVVNAIPNSTK